MTVGVRYLQSVRFRKNFLLMVLNFLKCINPLDMVVFERKIDISIILAEMHLRAASEIG